MTPLKEMQDTLRGLRCWNLADGSFIGLVVTTSERLLSAVMCEVDDLELGAIRLIDWRSRKIIYSSGAEIRFRAIPTYLDAVGHMGQEYWAVCYLARIPDAAYQLINDRIRPPATHEPRKPGIHSRFGAARDQQRRVQQADEFAKSFQAPAVAYRNDLTGQLNNSFVLSGTPTKPGVFPSYKFDMTSGLSARLKQDDLERQATFKSSVFWPTPDSPVKTATVKITHETADGLLLWTDDKGNVCVVPREQINAAYKRKPAKTWDDHVNFFLAMHACQLGETQQKFQAQLDALEQEYRVRINRLEDGLFKIEARQDVVMATHNIGNARIDDLAGKFDKLKAALV